MEKNVLINGKLGDAFHSLYVCFHLWKNHGYKLNIYFDDKVEPFERGLMATFFELKPIIQKQPYTNSCQLHMKQHIDYDTSQFRYKGFLYHHGWSDIMIKSFFPNEEYIPQAWIQPFKTNRYERDFVLINRRNKNPMSDELIQSYANLIRKYPFEKRVFTGQIEDYDAFPLKDEVLFNPLNTLYDLYINISICDLFIGNQSSPLALAHALNVNRAIELLPTIDAIHYRAETKYYNNITFLN